MRRIKHGVTRRILYALWESMKKRCSYKKGMAYKYYGSRGISVCDEWIHDAKSFIEWCVSNGWEKGLQIDRIDNDKGYSPTNCQFLTRSHNIAKTGLNSRNTSGYKGVHFVNDPRHKKKKWKAVITYNQKVIYHGYFTTKELAAEARNKYIIENKLPHTIQEITNDKHAD